MSGGLADFVPRGYLTRGENRDLRPASDRGSRTPTDNRHRWSPHGARSESTLGPAKPPSSSPRVNTPSVRQTVLELRPLVEEVQATTATVDRDGGHEQVGSRASQISHGGGSRQHTKAVIGASRTTSPRGRIFFRKSSGIEVSRQYLSATSSQIKSKFRKAAERPGRKCKEAPSQADEGSLAPPPKPAPTGGSRLPGAMEALKPLVASLGKEQVKRIVDLPGQADPIPGCPEAAEAARLRTQEASDRLARGSSSGPVSHPRPDRMPPARDRRWAWITPGGLHDRPALQANDGLPPRPGDRGDGAHRQDVPRPSHRRPSDDGGAGLLDRRVPGGPLPFDLRHRGVPALPAAAGSPGRDP